MRRLVALTGCAVLVVLSACGPSESGSLGSAPTSAPHSSADTTPSPSPQLSGIITVQVWFTRNGQVLPTRRTRPRTLETSRLTLTELVAGPSALETAEGVSNGIAGDTTFQIEGITDGVATVNFPPSFYAGGGDVIRLRQAQVVYSLTQFPTVSRVGFKSAGVEVGGPHGRDDYKDLIPPIVAMSPVIGQRVSSPVTITGTAEVREATVNMRILDAAGREIATKFAKVACGRGCRGDYTAIVSYHVCGSEQRGTVEIFEVSRQDGARLNTYRIPVILAACR